MPEPTDHTPDLDELRRALDHATVEAKRWKTVAHVLADRIRELADPPRFHATAIPTAPLKMAVIAAETTTIAHVLPAG